MSSAHLPRLGNFGYTNLYYDPITGLYFAGARVYDPSIAQWLTVDPLGLAGGLSNFRDYVGNNATNAKDLSGMAPPIGTFLKVQQSFNEKLKDNTIAVADGNLSITADLVVYQRKFKDDKLVDRVFIRFSDTGVKDAKVPASAYWLQVATENPLDAVGAPANFDSKGKKVKNGYSTVIFYKFDPDAPKEIPKDKAVMPVAFYHPNGQPVVDATRKVAYVDEIPTVPHVRNKTQLTFWDTPTASKLYAAKTVSNFQTFLVIDGKLA